MPGMSSSEFNIVDSSNSTTVLLIPFAEFVGSFVDVTAYSSISVATKSDVGSSFAGIQVEWSTDGITADIAPQRFTFDPFAISQDGFVVHVTVRASFYRVRYLNSNLAQTSFVLTALLRKGTPVGTVRSIDPVNTFTTNLDVLTVQAILSGVGRANNEQVQMPMMDDVDLPSDGPFIFVSPRPGKNAHLLRRTVGASLTPILLNPTPGFVERPYIQTFLNNTKRGNLYIQLDTSSGLTTSQYDYVIPPGHCWSQDSPFGTKWCGDIYGLWDEVYVNDDASTGNSLFTVAYF
jgi:hypothetical protein